MNGNSTLVHQANFSGGGFAKLLPFFFFFRCCCCCFALGPAYLFYFFVGVGWRGGGRGGHCWYFF